VISIEESLTPRKSPTPPVPRNNKREEEKSSFDTKGPENYWTEETLVHGLPIADVVFAKKGLDPRFETVVLVLCFFGILGVFGSGVPRFSR